MLRREHGDSPQSQSYADFWWNIIEMTIEKISSNKDHKTTQSRWKSTETQRFVLSEG